MKKKMLTAVLSVALVQAVSAQGFLQKLQQKMQAAQSGQSGGGSGGAAASNSSTVGGEFCQQFFGKPFKEKKLDAPVETIVSKYFKIGAEADKELMDGINSQYNGTLVSLKLHLDDLKDNVVRQLADAFLANPSIPMLAQVIKYAEAGDGYASENRPSELAEAQTLLAMVMMQYPKLTLNNGYVNQLLKQAESKNSGLARTLLARNYFFGDYAQQNINSFSGYIAQAQKHYPVKLADRTVFLALERLPNWQYRQQYLDLLRQSQQMQQNFQRQQQAAKSSNLNARALNLMREGAKADMLTLEALGAGPKVAEIKAKGEMLRKEASGEANLIKVEVGASDDAKAEILKMLAAAPKLDDAAKAKLQEANKLKADNLSNFYSISTELALKFFSGDVGSAIETGQLINHYARNTCTVINRQVEVAKQSGIPEPQMDKGKLAESML